MTSAAAEMEIARKHLTEAVAALERAREAVGDPHLAAGLRNAAVDAQAAARKVLNAANWIRTVR